MTTALRYTIGDPGRAAERIGPGRPSPFPDWPDVDLHSTDALGLTVRAASVRGLAHRAYGSPRQDAYAVRELDCGAVVVVVCDGVGSLEFSHEAAALAAAELPGLISELSGRTPDWPRIVAALSTRIREHADGAAEQPRPMATTVVAAVVTSTGTGGYRAELGWVGDSAARLLRGGVWTALTAEAADGELLTGVTAALPAEHPEVRSCAVDLVSGDALFLMTDGVAVPLGSGGGEVGSALAQWWAAPPEAEVFGAQVAFERRTFDDDRTVVGLWCPPSMGLQA